MDVEIASGSTPLRRGDRWISVLGSAVLVAWLAYLLFAPTIGFNWIESWHNEQRAAQIALLAATAVVYVVVAALQVAGLGPHRLLRLLPIYLIAFFALGIASSWRSMFVHAALADVNLFALLAILAALTATIVSLDVKRAHSWARWFSVLFASAYVLGVATRYLAAVSLSRSIDLDVLILGYANPRFPSAFHVLMLPFLAAAASDRQERTLVRVPAFVSLCFLWAINLGLGTRGIWLAFAVGLPASMILLGPGSSKRLTIALVLGCVAGILLYAVLFRFGPSTVGNGTAVPSPLDNVNTVTSRDVLWQLSWQAIRSSPFLGIGPMQFASYGSQVGAHPHNWMLQIGSEWGLVALALLLWGLYVLMQLVRRARGESRLVAPVTAVLAALVLGLVDGNLIMPVSQTGFFLVLGLLVGTLAPRHEVNPAPRGRLVLICTFGAAAATMLPMYAVESYSLQPTEISRFQNAHPGMWMVPRFWEQGLLISPRSTATFH